MLAESLAKLEQVDLVSHFQAISDAIRTTEEVLIRKVSGIEACVFAKSGNLSWGKRGKAWRLRWKEGSLEKPLIEWNVASRQDGYRMMPALIDQIIEMSTGEPK